MKKPKENKLLQPAEETKISAEGQMVKIRFRQGRGAVGVVQDANRCAEVDQRMADTLIGLGYADAVVEPSAPVEPEAESTEPSEYLKGDH